jgi:hypothetical protein
VEEEKEGMDCDGPRESRLVNVSILHYTYPAAVDRQGRMVTWEERAKKAVWEWNKRTWMGDYPRLPFPRLPRCTEETIAEVISRIERAGMSPELWPWWQANMAPPPPPPPPPKAPPPPPAAPPTPPAAV